jgi:hypothetical protein
MFGRQTITLRCRDTQSRATGEPGAATPLALGLWRCDRLSGMRLCRSTPPPDIHATNTAHLPGVSSPPRGAGTRLEDIWSDSVGSDTSPRSRITRSSPPGDDLPGYGRDPRAGGGATGSLRREPDRLSIAGGRLKVAANIGRRGQTPSFQDPDALPFGRSPAQQTYSVFPYSCGNASRNLTIASADPRESMITSERSVMS